MLRSIRIVLLMAVALPVMGQSQSPVGTWKGGYTFGKRPKDMRDEGYELFKAIFGRHKVTLVLKPNKTFTLTKIDPNMNAGKPLVETGRWAQFGSSVTIESPSGPAKKLTLGKNKKKLSFETQMDFMTLVLHRS